VQIAKLRYVEGQVINDELFALSCEPDLRVRIYSACLVNGVRFHTVDREKIEEHKIVELCLRVHMTTMILTSMVP